MDKTGEDFDWSNISNNNINAMKFAAQQVNIHVANPQTKDNYIKALTQYRDEQMKSNIKQPSSHNSRSPTPIKKLIQSPPRSQRNTLDVFIHSLKTNHLFQIAVVLFVGAIIALIITAIIKF